MAKKHAAAEIATLADLKPAAYNPRTISEKAAAGLSRSLSEFGDISGIVFNVRTGNLVAGHQRVNELKKLFGDLPIKGDAIVTKSGERFAVRMVNWDLKKERTANVAANSQTIAGEWDDSISDLLGEIKTELPELYADMQFGDLEFPQFIQPQGSTHEVQLQSEFECTCPKCGFQFDKQK